MKPFIQKLTLNENTSFVAKTFKTPNFEVGWHQHIEYELILFTQGSGLSFVGNHVGEFETGDIYFLGSNLPHTFQKRDPELITSAMVVQFREDFWGTEILNIPESRYIKKLLLTSLSGLKITGDSRQLLFPLISNLETAIGFQRILILGQCLEIIATSKEYVEISTLDVKQMNNKDKECIDRIFQFTIDSFKESISLSQVADIASMSIPAFCNYFKKSTKKTYINFLNEIRIGYACTSLVETKKTVLDICFDSGYNTMANFHKQFLKIKKTTPLQYRLWYFRHINN
ncbi:AraC-type DNA-binding protein [Pedobacter steynii]|uniref:AraC-type DNA-binding protein n=1 Tax=Pedobacter steynii TaxID=430522 RepID=A0A1G9Z063_9SPHI|nr:AraC family transcriptional regulator [Pedobacter steynii]NQX39900.1 helix-turn-helix transcriptional regulator [Pedobacter steynii]SDN14714.1 AraC-type DNA-binding protein [Pedobacter steynii]